MIKIYECGLDDSGFEVSWLAESGTHQAGREHLSGRCMCVCVCCRVSIGVLQGHEAASVAADVTDLRRRLSHFVAVPKRSTKTFPKTCLISLWFKHASHGSSRHQISHDSLRTGCCNFLFFAAPPPQTKHESKTNKSKTSGFFSHSRFSEKIKFFMLEREKDRVKTRSLLPAPRGEQQHKVAFHRAIHQDL